MPKEDFIKGQSKIEDFWKFINARHTIYLKRKAKQPKPWSDDPIFQEWKFTNVFRELDRGTIALRGMLKTLYKEYICILQYFSFNPSREIITAEEDQRQRKVFNRGYIRNQFITCILYRMFNWHENAKFGPITNQTAWWHYLRQEQSIDNQIFGGAYILPSEKGEKKLDTFERLGREIVSDADDLISEIQEYNTLEYAWGLLGEYKHIGPFIAYEFVCDLRYTDILRNATDTCTWCNIGDGARRGLERMGLEPALKSIVNLFLNSQNEISGSSVQHWIYDHWVYYEGIFTRLDDNDFQPIYPYWELREIEHCLCELDKYERGRLGQGRPKAKFRGV